MDNQEKTTRITLNSKDCKAVIKFRDTPNPKFQEYCEEIYGLLASYYKIKDKET